MMRLFAGRAFRIDGVVSHIRLLAGIYDF